MRRDHNKLIHERERPGSGRSYSEIRNSKVKDYAMNDDWW